MVEEGGWGVVQHRKRGVMGHHNTAVNMEAGAEEWYAMFRLVL